MNFEYDFNINNYKNKNFNIYYMKLNCLNFLKLVNFYRLINSFFNQNIKKLSNYKVHYLKLYLLNVEFLSLL